MNLLSILAKIMLFKGFFIIMLSNIMIDIRYLHHIPEEKWDECYLSLINDVYYFYNGIKPLPDQYITTLDGDKFNLSKDNLILYSNTTKYFYV